MDLKPTDRFVNRHIGPNEGQLKEMLKVIGVTQLETLIEQTVPADIRLENELDLPSSQSEYTFLRELRKKARKNKVFTSYIGMGYYGTVTPTAIKRNVFENPGWYTQYTPYQAEISQGRLQALLNFQTMVCDLTCLPVANASLLDEGTAAAEAMTMFFHQKNKKQTSSTKFFVDQNCFPQTVDVLRSRALPIGIELIVGDYREWQPDETFFGGLVQNPSMDGTVHDYRSFVDRMHNINGYVCVAADIMSLAIITPPGEMGADCSVGNTQRFGVPMGFGGPHAAYFATTEHFMRQIPGRIIGVSIDMAGNPALRMALQTREQHIKRDKATSNICTAQALLAIMAGMYTVYHGPTGLRDISGRIHMLTTILVDRLKELGISVDNESWFDTISIDSRKNKLDVKELRDCAEKAEINFQYSDDYIRICLDETVVEEDLQDILAVFSELTGKSVDQALENVEIDEMAGIPANLIRTSDYLTHPVFNQYHSETLLMRYIKSLENKDLSLTHAMIPLGSCTMKLNAATELDPVSWAEFSFIHPFVPAWQAEGYAEIIRELEAYLNEITGFDATSLQPNSGAQGEFAGLSVIRAYQDHIGQSERNIALIPSSAHGTNPASAVMSGMKVVVVKCDDQGNIDIDDLLLKAQEHHDKLSCLMVTYPSTHGVFEDRIKEICEIIHAHGGQVYMDGANMNAQVGLTSPAIIGADVCHLNLHKTFAIPHGGGGPGVGPICVREHLAPFLPSNPLIKTGGEHPVPAIASAPWGSASILLISYGYIRMLGTKGVTEASKMAILNANYIKSRLEDYYYILYTGRSFGRVAHELIIDLRPFKHTAGIEAEDVAKRMIDYGFHAPTLSWPVPGTIMIEPTESEDKRELDRFCDTMIEIRKEIMAIETESVDREKNVLKQAPHTLEMLTSDHWSMPYSREEAAYPIPMVRNHKFWPSIRRVNNTYGDRNIVCTCPDISAYEED